MSDVLNYFLNVQFDKINDTEILQNIYNEINKNLKEIILNRESCYRLETLLHKSTSNQLLDFLKNIDIKYFITKKLGSRILEKVFTLLFMHIYVHKSVKIEEIEIFLKFLEKNFLKLFYDPCGTFVVRIYFQILSAKFIFYDTTHQKMYGVKDITNCKYRVLKYSKYCKVDFKMDKKMNSESSLVDYKHRKLDSFYEFLENDISDILSQKHTSLSLLTLILCMHKKNKIIKKINNSSLCADRLKEPVFSYFYQTLISKMRQKNLIFFYKKIKPHFIQLSTHPISNYVIQTLIHTFTIKYKFYYQQILQNHHLYNRNSNILLNLVICLQKEKKYKKIQKIMQAFYYKNDFFEEVLLIRNSDSNRLNGVDSNTNNSTPTTCVNNTSHYTSTIDSKFVQMTVNFLKSKEENEISKNIKIGFKNNFTEKFLENINGLKIVLAFLQGNTDLESKRWLVSYIYDRLYLLGRNYYGIKVLQCMSQYCDEFMKRDISSLVRKSKMLLK